MEKYNWLQKKQSKALAVFREAGEQLAKVKDQLLGEISANADEISELHCEINARIEEIAYLRAQHDQVHEQHEKITAIVGPAGK